MRSPVTPPAEERSRSSPGSDRSESRVKFNDQVKIIPPRGDGGGEGPAGERKSPPKKKPWWKRRKEKKEADQKKSGSASPAVQAERKRSPTPHPSGRTVQLQA